MNEILEAYQEQIKASAPWIALLQSKAIADFNRHGFPKRDHEDWKYTDLASLLKLSFVPPAPASSPYTLGAQDVPVKKSLIIHNGNFLDPESLVKTLPPGVLIQPLSQALSQHEDLVRPYLGTILQQEHAFHFLNTARMQGGLFIYIPPGVSIEEPIAIVHIQDQNKQELYLRHLVIAAAHSQCTLVEEYRGKEGCCYLTNAVTEVSLGTASQLTHYKIQNESKAAYHLGHLSVKQLARSQLFSHSLSLGGALVRSDTSISLQEEHAQCLMNGIYAPTQGQHIDHHTLVHHEVAHGVSDQDYKGILSGSSRAVFNGRVVVAKNAQHTKARQQNKNLLLSDLAEIDTKPQLEIFADDVLCSHGATVGQLDEESLFYLATRGMDRAQASHCLIQAFAQENLQRIAHPKLADWMGRLLMEQLG